MLSLQVQFSKNKIWINFNQQLNFQKQILVFWSNLKSKINCEVLLKFHISSISNFYRKNISFWGSNLVQCMQKSFKQNLEWEGCWKVLLKTTGKGNPGKSLLCKFIFKWFLTQNKSWISFWTVCRPPLESFSRRLAGKRRGTNSCRPGKEI